MLSTIVLIFATTKSTEKKTFFIYFLDHRSNTIRKKRWSPELEQKIKHAFNVIKNEDEAIQYLMGLGLTAHEIDLVLQHFLNNTRNRQQLQPHHQRTHEPNNTAKHTNGNIANSPQTNSSTNPSTNATYAQTPMSSSEQQLELIGFSQSVSNLFH